MKKTLSLILAGFVGAVIALYGFQLMQPKSVMLENISPTQVSNTINTTTPYPFDFIKASEASTKVVVQIKAQESPQLANDRYRKQQRNNPYAGSIFEDFFGGYSYGQPRIKAGTGSGVIVSSDGYIVTNNHVAGFADDILVTLSNKKEYKAVKIGTDPSTDLALLKIEAEGLPTMEYADSDKIRVGEWVLAVGNPFSYLTSTVTAGIVSAKGRDINIIEADKSIEEFIQTDAAVNPGNSGGAMVDSEGRLVGIITAIATPTGSYAGYSFAIPSNLVKRIVKDIKENGDIRRANIGVQGGVINKEIAEENDLGVDYGFYVDKIVQRSAAQFGGILPGDIITSVNNKKIKTFEDLSEEMKYKKEGDVLDVEVYRDGVKRTIQVKLRSTM